jgi:hypothetical protein
MKCSLQSTAAILAMLGATCAAQGQVYESTGKGGVPEFSDQATPGSKQITVPTPNVSDAPLPSVQPPTPTASPAYSQLSIVSPAMGGTVHSNTGEFDVSLNLQPALNSGRGDRFMVTLDGNALPGRYASGTIGITSQDFDAAAVDNEQHQLQVSVVDSNGNVLIAAGPVSFYIKRATVRRRGRR